MQIIVILGVLGALVGSSFSVPRCEVRSKMISCLTESGLSREEAKAFVKIPSHRGKMALTGDDLRKRCEKRSEYDAALPCIAAALSECTPGVDQDDMERFFEAWDSICDDANFNFDCYAEVMNNHKALKSCMNENIDFPTAFRTMSREELGCTFARVGGKCKVGLLRECDEYTATVAEETMKKSIPEDCRAN